MRQILLVLLIASLVGCGSPSMNTRDVEVDESYVGGPPANMLVLSLQEDSVHDSRVVIERGFTQQLKNAGVDAIAGYTRFDSIDALVADPDSFEPALKDLGIASVVFLEPIKMDLDYDPGEYAQRRSAYRALGLDTSASINLISDLAREASAAKVVMNVGLWMTGTKDDVFNATYDINAPGSYDVDTARGYASQFALNVIDDFKQYGFIR